MQTDEVQSTVLDVMTFFKSSAWDIPSILPGFPKMFRRLSKSAEDEPMTTRVRVQSVKLK